MSEGVRTLDGSFMGTNIGTSVTTVSPGSQSSNVNTFEDLSASQLLFPNTTSFTLETFNQPAGSQGKEQHGSTNLGSMSTADMF